MLLKELIFSKVAARNSFLLAQEFCLDFREIFTWLLQCGRLNIFVENVW